MLSRAHKVSIAIGSAGVLGAIGSVVLHLGQTATCLAQSWVAEAPLLTAIAGIAAATAPFFAIYAKAKDPS